MYAESVNGGSYEIFVTYMWTYVFYENVHSSHIHFFNFEDA